MSHPIAINAAELQFNKRNQTQLSDVLLNRSPQPLETDETPGTPKRRMDSHFNGTEHSHDIAGR